MWESADDAQRRLASVVVITCWAQVVIPRAVQSLTAPKLRAAVGEATIGYTHAAQLCKDVLTLAVLGLCVVAAVSGLRARRGSPVGALVIMLLPWGYLMVRDAYAGTGFQLAVLLYPAIVLALWSLRPSLDLLRTLGILVGLTAIVCMAMAVCWPDSAIFRSASGTFVSEDKQILPWGMLEGYLTQPNNLGQTLAAGLPTVFLIRHRAWRATFVAATVLAVVWSASRSSLYALAITAGIALILIHASPRMRRRLAAVALVALAAVVTVVPLVTVSQTAFTDRGYIWHVSLPAWRAHPWVGNGANWYDKIAATAANLGTTVFHGHNQVIQLLVTGGVLLTLIVAVQYAWIGRQAIRLSGTTGLVATTLLIALAGTCILEVSLAYVDNFSMLFVTAVPIAIIAFGRYRPDSGDGMPHEPGPVVVSAPQPPSSGSDRPVMVPAGRSSLPVAIRPAPAAIARPADPHG